MDKFGIDDKVDEYAFFDMLISNNYWKLAGEVVVKELIYLDAVRAVEQGADPLLSDHSLEVLKVSTPYNFIYNLIIILSFYPTLLLH